jgi:hypothetical protein
MDTKVQAQDQVQVQEQVRREKGAVQVQVQARVEVIPEDDDLAANQVGIHWLSAALQRLVIHLELLHRHLQQSRRAGEKCMNMHKEKEKERERERDKDTGWLRYRPLKTSA